MNWWTAAIQGAFREEGVFNRPRNRLAIRQTLLAVSIACVLGFALAAVQVILDRDDEQQDMVRDIANIVGSVKEPAANALWELNGNLASAIVDGLFGYDLIIEAKLLTRSGLVLALQKRALADDGKVILSEWLFGPARSLNVPISYNDAGEMRPVGSLIVVSHPHAVAGQFLNRALVIALSGFAKGLLLAIFLSAAFYLTLTKPLHALAQQLEAVRPTGESMAAVQVAARNKDDELGRIADVANYHLRLIRKHLEELNHAQEAMRETNEMLEQSVGERTAELTEEIESRIGIENQLRIAVEEAHKNAESRSRFMANMSHELRTPLNAIIGYSEFTKLQAGKLKPDELAERLDHIHGAGSHLLSLVNSILDLSRMDAGRMPVSAERFAFNEMVVEIANHLEPIVTRNGNKLVQELDPTTPAVFTDRMKARQILINLIGNAAKFTEGGEITIRTQVDRMTPDKLLVEVQDTGIGIENEAIEKIFESFTQADASLARRYQGSGLGLAIVSATCKLLGWEIYVTSKVGRGSSFYLEIPINGPSAGFTKANF